MQGEPVPVTPLYMAVCRHLGLDSVMCSGTSSMVTGDCTVGDNAMGDYTASDNTQYSFSTTAPGRLLVCRRDSGPATEYLIYSGRLFSLVTSDSSIVIHNLLGACHNIRALATLAPGTSVADAVYTYAEVQVCSTIIYCTAGVIERDIHDLLIDVAEKYADMPELASPGKRRRDNGDLVEARPAKFQSVGCFEPTEADPVAALLEFERVIAGSNNK